MTPLPGKSDNNRSHNALHVGFLRWPEVPSVHPSWLRHNPVSFAHRNNETSHHSFENIAASIEGAAQNSVLASLSFRSDASPTQGGRTCQKWDRSETRHRAVRSPRARQLIQNAAQSLSDRSPAPASAAMPGSIEQAAEANQQGSHSSDVEQPHCRRTRADSSPAASTKFEYPDLPDFLKRGAA